MLAYALYRVELLGKRLDANLRELREALTHELRREVRRAAYGVVFVTRARLRRDHRGEARAARARDGGAGGARAEAQRRWLSSSSFPALLAYGEAAFAYAGELRGPGLAGRLATWGVRLGWLAQTALLVGQAASAEGFPWGTWAGALNLFVWLVVGAYLIWGCTPRYRLLGLTVMPVAAALLALAWAGGGTALDDERPLRGRARGARRADAGRLRGPDARRRDGRALSLAGAPPEAPRARRPEGARAAARRARPARRAHRARLARAADARDRRRRRQLRARRLRRRDGGHAGRLGDLRVAARASPRGVARPAGGARSTWPASRSSPSSSP